MARFLGSAGAEAIEVDRPNRQARRRNGKSDPGDALVITKHADGYVEAMRALLMAKRSGREAGIQHAEPDLPPRLHRLRRPAGTLLAVSGFTLAD